MRRLSCALLPILFAVACSGGGSTTSPTPAPTVLSVSASGDWPTAARPDSSTVTGNGNALGVAAAPNISGGDGKDAGAVWIAIKATASGLGQVRGDLKWDPALLTFDAYSDGEWFKQGGALVTWTLLTATSGQVTFLLDRPSTTAGATGTGTVVYLRLRGRAKGTSPLQWSNPELRGPDFSARPLTGGSFGGSITVQ